MCKGFNKIVNEITKQYGYIAKPSKNLKNHDISFDKKLKQIRYNINKFKNYTINKIDRIICDAITMSSHIEERHFYC